VGNGGLNTWLPPHELVTVKVPVDGGVVVLMVPVRVNVPGATHGPGVAVIAVILHRIAQFVVPSAPGAFCALAVILVARPEKLVISNMYHCPATAPVISTCSVDAVEKLQSIGEPVKPAHIAPWVANGPHNAKSISLGGELVSPIWIFPEVATLM
jgi:hypothetical protein